VRSRGLSAEEQDELWACWRQGASLRLMARKLGKRGPSVRAFVLQTGGVQQQAAKLVLEPRLRAVVEAKLTLRWSPQQIAGWLPLASP
jgi:IS30 family transposase